MRSSTGAKKSIFLNILATNNNSPVHMHAHGGQTSSILKQLTQKSRSITNTTECDPVMSTRMTVQNIFLSEIFLSQIFLSEITKFSKIEQIITVYPYH